MQFTPLQIKEKLLRALDDDNNVVDAEAVLEVISILEQYPITRDALEQTRIGKHMNELRKKTTNEQLAKRAKKLVKNWQKLVSSEPSGRGTANGERVVTPIQHPCVEALQRGGNGAMLHGGISSPALSQSGKNSPVPGRRCMSPMAGGKPLAPQMGERTPKCNSPAMGGKPATPTLQTSRLSPALKHSPSAGKPLTPSLQSSRQSPGQGSRTSQVGSGRSTTPTLASRPPSGSRASPVLSNNSRNSSPAHKLASVDISPRLDPRNTSSPKSHSPKLDRSSASVGGRPATPSGRAFSHLSSSRPATPNNNENSNSSWPNTPLSGGHTEHEKNNSNSRIKSKAKLESDSSSVTGWKRDSPQMFASKSNHSTEVSNSSDKGSRKDQSDTSKTNVANRKRTRNQSPDSVPQKQPKTDNSCLSKEKRETTINGVMGSHKHHKKDKGDPKRSNSATSLSYSKGSELSPVSPVEKTEASYHLAKRQMNSKTELTPKAQKTSKVKTTEELIAELQKRAGSSSYGNDIMSKIKSNQIEKEVDAPRSVLPPSVKPRKKRGSMSSENLALLDQSSSTELLSQTKNEMMEKFLESSVSHSVSGRISHYKDDSFSNWESPMGSTNSFEERNMSMRNSASVNRGKPNAHNSVSEVKTEGNMVAAVAAKQLTLEEILQLLPQVDVNSVDWEAQDYSLGEPVAGTEDEVERLHTDKWENVNGCFDVNGQWHDWSQTLSRTTCEGDLLHILPYVNIDD